MLSDLEKERQIINQVILDSRAELEDILNDYTNFLKKDPEDLVSIRGQIINAILEYFLKVIYRMNRFSDFKSKIRVLEKSQSVSQKEIDRCEFIIKLVTENTINILKNNFSDAKGTYRCTRKKTKKKKKRK